MKRTSERGEDFHAREKEHRATRDNMVFVNCICAQRTDRMAIEQKRTVTKLPCHTESYFATPSYSFVP